MWVTVSFRTQHDRRLRPIEAPYSRVIGPLDGSLSITAEHPPLPLDQALESIANNDIFWIWI
jgi:hypothetical protein